MIFELIFIKEIKRWNSVALTRYLKAYLMTVQDIEFLKALEHL